MIQSYNMSRYGVIDECQIQHAVKAASANTTVVWQKNLGRRRKRFSRLPLGPCDDGIKKIMFADWHDPSLPFVQ